MYATKMVSMSHAIKMVSMSYAIKNGKYVLCNKNVREAP